ncbi:MAG: UDP-N-acetylmuramate--L-alanine ligase [Planctomycetes bacterium]|nr:UDP-N-acetylmuramate--L-alanine ligase [Planctomycetota bacterium]
MNRRTTIPIRRAHLVGIGGSGMSGLARMLTGLGVAVTGSDAFDSPNVRALRALGLRIDVGHGAQDLPNLEDGWLVRSAAIPDDNPELLEARSRRIPCLFYAEAIGTLSTGRRTIAVAGTHGKTSTTAMCVAALHASRIDCSYLVGGELIGDDIGNGHGGQSDLFVVEACEFNRSFHQLRPTFGAILNLDSDHFDCYPNLEALEESFAAYAGNLRHGGKLYVHENVPDTVFRSLPKDVTLTRIGAQLFADVRAIDVVDDLGRFSFTPSYRKQRLPRVALQVPGKFQVFNAMFALAMAVDAGADPEFACRGLSDYRGVARRFQIWHGVSGRHLVDDYAHHPREIEAVLSTVRRVYPGRPILVAFQPHQHSRTKHLLEDFGASLALADHCLVADIYAAREDPLADHGVAASDVVDAVRSAGGRASVAGPVSTLGSSILRELEDATIPVVLGAGELDGVVQEVVRGL